MSIQYAGGTNVHASINGANATTCVDEIKAALVTAGWSVASGSSGDWKLDSAATPFGLQLRVRLFTSGGNGAITVSSVDESASSIANGLQIVAARTYRLIANKYQFWVYLPTVVVGGSTSNFVAAGVPYLPAQVQPVAVTAATNTSPIQITAASHGMITAEQCYIQGVGGNTAANGLFTVTVIDANTFTLNSSTGNGAYTSGGYVGTPRKISRCIWAQSNPNAIAGSWRNDVNNSSGQDDRYFVVINESTWAADSGSGGGVSAPVPILLNYALYATNVGGNAALWFGSRYAIYEPMLRMNRLNVNTGGEIVGQLWDACLINQGYTIDIEDTFDSHNWHQMCSTGAAPSLWVVIP